MKSKKIFLTILFLLTTFSLTACANNTSSQNIANNQTDTKKITNTAQVGGLKIEGAVDAESLGKNSKVISPTSNSSSNIITGKKGLLINDKGFNPKELDVPLGNDLMIYNYQGSEIQIVSLSKDCSEFNPALSLKNKETKIITFKEAKICEVYLNSKPELKASITVQ